MDKEALRSYGKYAYKRYLDYEEQALNEDLVGKAFCRGYALAFKHVSEDMQEAYNRL